MVRHSIDLDLNTVGMCLELSKCKGSGFYSSSKHVCYYPLSKCETAVEQLQKLRLMLDDCTNVEYELNFVLMTHKIKIIGDHVYDSLQLNEETQTITYKLCDYENPQLEQDCVIRLKDLPSNPVLHAKGVCNDSDGYYRGFLIWG